MKLKDLLGFDPTPKAVYRYRCRVWEGTVEKLKEKLREANSEKMEAVEQFRVADLCEKKAQKRLSEVEQELTSARNKMGQMRKEIRRGIAETTRLQRELTKSRNQIAALRQNLAVVREQADNYAKERRLSDA